MYYSIARIEGQFAICEDENGNFKSVELKYLPDGAKEGSVMRYDGEAYALDQCEEKRRRDRARRRISKLCK